jgi:hypothetical protein
MQVSGRGSCPLSGLGIGDVETSISATIVLAFDD